MVVVTMVTVAMVTILLLSSLHHQLMYMFMLSEVEILKKGLSLIFNNKVNLYYNYIES